MRPPIEASRVHAVRSPTPLDKLVETGTVEGADTEEPTPPPVGFQGTSVLRDLESIASPNPNIQKHATNPTFPNSTNNTPSTSTVNRFIRRQHQKLLGRIPILTYLKHPNSPVGKYEVSLSPLASSSLLTGLTLTVPMADEADLAWLRLPPPPLEPGVDLESPLSQEPKMPMADRKPEVDQDPRAYEKSKHAAHPCPQRANWVDGDDPPEEHRPEEGVPEVESKPMVEEHPKTKMKEVGENHQVRMKSMRTARPYHLGSDRTGGPPHPEDLRKPRRFSGTADERPQRGELPPRSGPPALKGVRLFKGSMVGRGFGEPHPKP